MLDVSIRFRQMRTIRTPLVVPIGSLRLSITLYRRNQTQCLKRVLKQGLIALVSECLASDISTEKPDDPPFFAHTVDKTGMISLEDCVSVASSTILLLERVSFGGNLAVQ